MTDWVAELLAWCSSYVTPARFKRSQIRVLCRPSAEILLVGTIHGRHLVSPCYNLGVLENIVRQHKPDCLLLEIRPHDLETGLLNIAPVEMAHLALVGRASGIQILGIDWWSEVEAQRRAESGRSLQLGSERRHTEMFALISRALGNCRRPAVFVGFSHVPSLERHFYACGYNKRPLTTSELDKFLAGGHAALRLDMQDSVAASLAHCKRDLAAYPYVNAWSKRIQRKILELERLSIRLTGSVQPQVERVESARDQQHE